jgi:hypothetical protein
MDRGGNSQEGRGQSGQAVVPPFFASKRKDSSKPEAIPGASYYRQRGALHGSAGCTDCKRGLLYHAFPYCEGSGKSKAFYVRILGGKVIKVENPCYIKLANSWIILNSGGGPTPDKPEVLLEAPSDLNRVNSFLNLRVADIRARYKEWRGKGAFFLTEPLDNHGWEWRCYMREPDGYLIEVGQYTQMAVDRFKNYAG